ncbi:pseudouridine synthase [Corynebacterium yudongzhengii]|uniref:RNA pseudouridylate synthase n=1 Tax=Corynebacterium yudongzhengii TaxID=2080740 RepID=A0A2U1T469_9CORY|nr:pseudouridine synthase [Corynebacterium yudongzhengii]AWB82169.1 pseudouridine synthase [Corynebacterium yudongzhengii]PWC00800.1 pseudouridine synthase [Corynebacterium yudongzhengii]
MVLSGVVPEGEYWAARAGDSPFPAGTQLAAGTRLARAVPAWTYPELLDEPPIPFDYEVVYADAGIMIVDKPPFLPTTSNGRIQRETLQTRLRRDHGDEVICCHRLDRLTAGLVLCSRNPETRGAYQQLFARREVRKTYRALLSAPVSFPEWERVELTMNKPAGARRVEVSHTGTPTLTYVRGVGRLVEMRPVTGHTHQLRVVAQHLGAPIVGDDLYPEDLGRGLWDFSTRLHLLAERISFIDPLSFRPRAFRSPRPLLDIID